MEKLIITAAICGAEVSKQDNPNLPISPAELALAARECEDAGAAIIHLHVRNDAGLPTQELPYFQAAVEAIQKAGVRAIIQPSTGGAAGMSWEERIQPVHLDPEMASLDCGTLNFGDTIFINDLPLMRKFAHAMIQHQILPELECFEPGHIENALLLSKEGLLPGHLHFNIVLGVPGALSADIKHLLFMKEKLPPGSTWTGSGIGRQQLPIALHSMLMGGHVRVGFEDSIYYSKGVLAKSNAQLVHRIVRMAEEIGRPIASPTETREILGINHYKSTGTKDSQKERMVEREKR